MHINIHQYKQPSHLHERVLRSILDAGIPFDSLAFKDASGTSAPRKVYETIKRTREILGADAHIRFHSHETAGTGLAAYLAALEGGADGIDLAMKPVSGGTAQPDLVSMWHALKGTEYDLGIDINKILETEEIFKECMKDYFLPPEALAVNPMIISSPLPGGALTANTQMMRDNGVMDKFPEVVAAMKEVVEKGGFATSVTPVSQFYFQQAFNNVMFGSWKKMAEGYGKMVLGYFGKTPCEPDPEIVKIAEEQLGLQPTTELVVDLNDKDPNKGIAAATKMLMMKTSSLQVLVRKKVLCSYRVKDKSVFVKTALNRLVLLFLLTAANILLKLTENLTQLSLKVIRLLLMENLMMFLLKKALKNQLQLLLVPAQVKKLKPAFLVTY